MNIVQLIGADADAWTAAAVGMLIQESTGGIELYHSDLYRDGQAIFRYSKSLQCTGGRLLLHWSFGECGTHMDFAEKPMVYHRESGAYDLVIEVERSEYAPDGSANNNRVSISLAKTAD